MAAEAYRDSIYIEAPPEIVFDYFTKPEALVSWMGDRAILDPRPNGEFTLFFDDRCVEGRYLEIERPRRLVITWGRQGSGELPPFSSTLEVAFALEGAGTRVSIVHHGLPMSEIRRHALGWQHYLERLRVVGSGGTVDPHRMPAELAEGAD
ncbi:MAG: hypothetical protein JWO36_4749 [Myxococcales bacterium]|nr:hypothetical protein [Myxococcales bacterium]